MTEIGIILHTAFSLALIWMLLYLGWKPYRLDKVRNELFGLRNELFLYAVEGGISFDNPAYRILRDRINAQIRYAHFMTLTRAVLFGIMYSKHPLASFTRVTESWESAYNALNGDARAKLDNITERVTRVMTRYLILGALPFALLVLLFGLMVKIARLFNRAEESTTLRVAKELNVELIEEQAVWAQQQERAEREACPLTA